MKISIILSVIILIFILILSIVLSIVLYKINQHSSTNDLQSNQSKPYENHDLFEGDIRFPESETRGVLLRGNNVGWPNGIVPYVIASGYTSENEQYLIDTMAKMEDLLAVNNVKCVQFRPKVSTDQYYITIRNGAGCSSYVGRNTGFDIERTVVLQEDGCLDDGRVMHELIHTLGFFHEQSRPDRDDYIRINYENIISGMERNFDKYDNSYVNTQNTPYDYGSVMHYERDAFSSNGLPTIEPLQSGANIGQRDGMSSIDIEEIRLFYNCISSNGYTPAPTTTTTTVNFYKMNTVISSELTRNSFVYVRSGGTHDLFYYYDVYQLTVSSNSYYKMYSSASFDTYAFLYQQNFDPNSPNTNLISSSDDDGGSQQFLISTYLQTNIQYFIVFTTYGATVTGTYTLTVSGLTNVNLRKINSNPITTTTHRSISTTANIRTSIYTSSLTSNSLTFNRLPFGNNKFYYESILIQVSKDGYYTFECESLLDTYGYLYLNSFNPQNITQNLISIDDDTAGNYQFSITSYLQTSNRYILVPTTFSANKTTPFKITAYGPDTLSFTSSDTKSTARITTTKRPTTTTPRRTTTIRKLTTTTPKRTTTIRKLTTTTRKATTSIARLLGRK